MKPTQLPRFGAVAPPPQGERKHRRVCTTFFFWIQFSFITDCWTSDWIHHVFFSPALFLFNDFCYFRHLQTLFAGEHGFHSSKEGCGETWILHRQGDQWAKAADGNRIIPGPSATCAGGSWICSDHQSCSFNGNNTEKVFKSTFNMVLFCSISTCYLDCWRVFDFQHCSGYQDTNKSLVRTKSKLEFLSQSSKTLERSWSAYMNRLSNC